MSGWGRKPRLPPRKSPSSAQRMAAGTRRRGRTSNNRSHHTTVQNTANILSSCGLRFTPFVPASGIRVSHTLNIRSFAGIQFPCFFDGLFLSRGDRRGPLGVRLSDGVTPLWTLFNEQPLFGIAHILEIYLQKSPRATRIHKKSAVRSRMSSMIDSRKTDI